MSDVRYRMVTAPCDGFGAQVGFVYELRPLRKTGWVKLRLVELPDQEPFSTRLEITIPAVDLGQHFEVVTAFDEPSAASAPASAPIQPPTTDHRKGPRDE